MTAADFSGYATKAGLKCSDGRTIMPHAFRAQDGEKVPLVWQHGHSDHSNILGHAVLENREDGVYCYGFFNETPSGQSAKVLVQHDDIRSLSIYANKLVERSKQVLHGTIREVSLVLSGANPGAFIDNVTVAHADGSYDEIDDEVIIYTGLEIEHSDDPETEEDEDTTVEPTTEETVEHAEDDTIADVYNSLTDVQKDVVHFMIGAALEEGAASHTDTDLEGSTQMARNVFEQTSEETASPALTHADMEEIVASASKFGSLKAAVEDYALAHGITNIDVLFPDAKTISDRPEWVKRRTEWVASVMSGTRHSPFSRIKTISADLTFEEARAKGYIKGTLKKEEFFAVAKRVTTPTTIYKKQKLDRDDIIDITDFDVVAWLKQEMRIMIEEEIARAILIGDGREVSDDDKISETNIRPIAKEAALYNTVVDVDDAWKAEDLIDQVLSTRVDYKGTGTPTFYTTEAVLTQMLLVKDTLGRRIYRSVGELASELRVAAIVPVEVMEDEADLVGVLVNLQDYVVGADRGGELSMFDDFDIDYNQYKYLIETRLSGALVKVKSAITYKKVKP